MNFIRHRHSLGCAIALLITLGATSPLQAQADPVDEFIQGYMRQMNVPGIAVAIVQGGRVVKAKGYGLANIDSGGEYCELVDGAWRQVGLAPNPNADTIDTFIADPLPNDPSFDSDHDERQ